ncbi:hypothetical protein L596_009360 [Steinernema carpocapsae]|uniref:Cytidyltransferase-like domain-containing protein n=1 Tax=Steinernema carpocapsae TaxID=34508 RepID=A0A4U5PFJ3_STECR|nr:hypothetical protein L596_009360 [Steinernema carpocapsae]
MASKEFFNGCKKVVLIACGSFNPPTVMHVRMFEVAKDFLQKKGVTVLEGIFSPAADNYAKKDLAKAKDRLKMCELATKESGWLRADGWECGQKKWTRTLAVLKHHLPLVRRNHAAKAAGDAEDVALVLLCGGDVVDSFTVIKPDGEPLWSPSDVQSILSDFGAVIVNRACSMPKETIKSINLDDFIDKTVHFTSVAPNEVSSTRLREAIWKTNRGVRQQPS